MINLDLISTRVAAEKLGVTPQTVARLVRRGELKAATQGPGLRGPLLFDPTQVDALAAKRNDSSKTTEVTR